jgi:ribulose-5-phosphate 4-epimerase/fuculose-1-phosphate aldolase
MLETLKENVCRADLQLVKENLVIQTWGNVSGIDREMNLVVIKPSGVSYDAMKPEQMVVVETFSMGNSQPDYKSIPAVLVAEHGPFAWGSSPDQAVFNAVILEHLAKMATLTNSINPLQAISQNLLNKHYLRKHGPAAYYGQKS